MARVGFDIETAGEKELLDHCEKVGKRLRNSNLPFHQTMRKCAEYYESSKDYIKKKLRSKRGKDNYVSARPWQHVEVMTSQMLGNRPVLMAEYPEEFSKNGQDAKVKDAMEFLNKSLWGRKEIDFENKLDVMERWREIMGTGLFKNDWLQEWTEKKEPIQIAGFTTPFKRTVKRLTKNEGDIKVVCPLRFFPDPGCETIRGQREFMEEVPMTWAEIDANGKAADLDGKPRFLNTDKVTEAMISDEENDTYKE